MITNYCVAMQDNFIKTYVTYNDETEEYYKHTKCRLNNGKICNCKHIIKEYEREGY